ncbi:MAG: hypothetical protein M0R51_15115 [Clostridia bacterium]|jgi:hypothetical protein|nr:hypothetical protein [Clostridia bacterium]
MSDTREFIDQAVSYSNYHYLPLLIRLKENENINDTDKKLLGFLYDDFSKLLNTLKKEGENE